MPTFDAVASATGSTPSFSFNITTTVADAVVFVNLGYLGAPIATGVTVGGGVTATLVDRAVIAAQIASEIWQAVGLGAAGTKAVVVTTDEASVAAGAISVASADQVTPVRGSAATATGNSTDPSVGVSSAVGDLVLDSVANRPGFFAAVNGGGDQTERFNQIPAAGHAGSTKSGDVGTVTMAWTIGGAGDWATVAISVRGPAGATPKAGAESEAAIVADAQQGSILAGVAAREI